MSDLREQRAAQLSAVEERLADAAWRAMNVWLGDVRYANRRQGLVAAGEELPPDPAVAAAAAPAWQHLVATVIVAEAAAVLGEVFAEELQDADVVSARAWQEDYLSRLPARVTDLPAATFELLRDELQDGIDKGQGIPTIRDRMATVLSVQEGGSENRWRKLATQIARTEATAVFNGGQQAAWQYRNQVTGQQTDKFWICTIDARTRDDHFRADGQRVPLDGEFIVGGHRMAHPGDPKAPVAQRKNCRCSLGEVAEGEEIPVIGARQLADVGDVSAEIASRAANGVVRDGEGLTAAPGRAKGNQFRKGRDGDGDGIYNETGWDMSAPTGPRDGDGDGKLNEPALWDLTGWLGRATPAQRQQKLTRVHRENLEDLLGPKFALEPDLWDEVSAEADRRDQRGQQPAPSNAPAAASATDGVVATENGYKLQAWEYDFDGRMKAVTPARYQLFHPGRQHSETYEVPGEDEPTPEPGALRIAFGGQPWQQNPDADVRAANLWSDTPEGMGLLKNAIADLRNGVPMDDDVALPARLVRRYGRADGYTEDELRADLQSAAEVLLDKVEAAPASEKPLYRGLRVAAAEQAFTVGQELDLDLASGTDKRRVASAYARGAGQALDPGRDAVLMVVRPGVRAADLDGGLQLGAQAGSGEHVLAGRGRVVDVRREGSQVVVEVEPVEDAVGDEVDEQSAEVSAEPVSAVEDTIREALELEDPGPLVERMTAALRAALPADLVDGGLDWWPADVRAVDGPGDDGLAWRVELGADDHDGEQALLAARTFRVGKDGQLEVYHDLLKLHPQLQGRGVASRFNRQMEDWYRANEVARIRLEANIDVGGYAWARAGYDFDVSDTLTVDGYRYVDHNADMMMMAMDRFAFTDLPADERAKVDAWAAAFAKRDVANWPTPLEISRLGWTEGATEWPGKTALLDGAWYGVKDLGVTIGDDYSPAAAPAAVPAPEEWLVALSDKEIASLLDDELAGDLPVRVAAERERRRAAGTWNTGPDPVSLQQRLEAAPGGWDGFQPLYQRQEEYYRELREWDNTTAHDVAAEWGGPHAYSEINKALYAGRVSGELHDGQSFRRLEEFVEAADEVFETAPPVVADVRVVRNTSSRYPDVAALLQGRPGDSFTSPGYTATSGLTHRDLSLMSLGGDVAMQILLPSGAQVLSIDGATGSGTREHEVLINRGAAFVLLDTPKEVDGTWQVSLALVP